MGVTTHDCVSRLPLLLLLVPSPTRKSGIAMIQDENPAPAFICEEGPAPESLPALPPVPANPQPNRRHDADAPDMFAVGVRVLRMAPAWLLTMTLGCTTLVLLLSWMGAGGAATADVHSPALNDARSSRPASAASAAGTTTAHQLEPARPANAAGSAPSADNKPATQAAAPTHAASSSEQPAASVAPPQSGEKVQPESPARGDETDAKFTVQVGSFNNQSEANEHVSNLRAAGFDSRTVAVEIQGRSWYRVQVGRVSDRGEATKTVASLRAKGAGGAIVVPLQN